MSDPQAELRIVERREVASEPPDEDLPPFATARKAVPLLWLGLFDYAEVEIRSAAGGDVLLAVTPVAAAVSRAEALQQALPPKPPALRGAVATLARELREAPQEQHLVLYPTEIFGYLRADAVRGYLQQLFHIRDVWEKLRKGTPWEDAQKLLERIGAGVGPILQQEERVVAYYLIGGLAERQDPLQLSRVSEGQGPTDAEPEALAAGEQGLLLGRFGGRWKLMSSGTDQNIHAAWGEPGRVWLVGRAGTVLRVRKGSCTKVEVPTRAHLHAVWGSAQRFVGVVGDDGTFLAFNGKEWQAWPVPTQAPLLCIGGTGVDNLCIGAQDLLVFRFDGRGWIRMLLPEQGMANRIVGEEGQIWAVGGSRRGGELYRLERGGWVADNQLPRLDWLESVWGGWAGELGVVPASGPPWVRRNGRWEVEPVPADRVTAAACGTFTVAVGRTGRFGVVLERGEGGWELKASVPDLQISTVWVAGRPKPPRLEEPPRADAAGGTS